MIRKIKNMVPNCITLLNLLSGCVAITFAFNAFDTYGGLKGWEWSAIMMGIAAAFDFMDGAAARLLHAKSEIGKELDSLSDLVSFGVAPGLLLMNVMVAAGAGWYAYIALFIPAMGALRLAKFNVDDTQAVTFKGLPIPANAIFWIGMVGAVAKGQLQLPAHVMALAIILIGLLMVSNLPMFSLKVTSFALRANFVRYLVIAAAVVFVATMGVAGFAATILLYIAVSALQRIIRVTTD